MKKQKNVESMKLLCKEHLNLQKSFCVLYRHMTENYNIKKIPDWMHEKKRLEETVKHFKSKSHHLQRKLEEADERCELLEFCLLEVEHQAKAPDHFFDIDGFAESWERNILKRFFVENESSCQSSSLGINVNSINISKYLVMEAEKETEKYRLQLEDTEKKLSALTKHLDSVLQCNSKLGVGMDYVIATVNELQSLMEWTSEKKEIKANEGMLLQKLQQLERIQKELEKTALESEQIRSYAQENEMGSSVLPAWKENTSLVAETEGTCNESRTVKHVVFKENNLENDEAYRNPNCVGIVETGLLIDLTTDDAEINEKLLKQSCICNKVEVTRNSLDPLDSLGPNVSEDEGLGEESRRGDSTGPSSFVDIHDSISNMITLDSLETHRNNVRLLIVPEDTNKSVNCITDAKDHLKSLESCMCALGNLKESFRAREYELSAIQNDQQQISELQDVIIKFHKDMGQLKSQHDSTKKENAALKEQVLELEEAENDARLQAQKLGEKLVFLQEKDSHFQAELLETKISLEKCIDKITIKESIESDLRSQLKYVETLVQKYEDKIHAMEVVELALREKLLEQEEAYTESLKRAIGERDRKNVAKGTQTYHGVASLQCGPRRNDCGVQTENNTLLHFDQTLHGEDAALKDSNSRGTPTVECPIQKELLKRLQQLVEEDAHLQQQLHYVDQINLTLWKKLHCLEFHIGECKKRNIPEDCGGDSCFECDSPGLLSVRSRPCSRTEQSDQSTKCETNKGILACFDESEQEMKQRLVKLEKINASFEKELETRQQLHLEKERRYGEWLQTEQRFIGDMKRLEDEKNALSEQVVKLENEKETLSKELVALQAKLAATNERHREEETRLKMEQEKIAIQLHLKIEKMLLTEREHLKQITNLKLESSKNFDKTESEKLKASYVQLQLDLSNTRDEMRILEEDYRSRLDEVKNRCAIEEARLQSELNVLRNKNSNCVELIIMFQARQEELIDSLKQKERELEQARLENKKSMETIEEQHRAIEAQLKQKLHQMEEGTAVTTRALTEERLRLEKELQGNIYDLRSKEELYMSKIAELETNVSHLHEELHRLTGDLDSGEPMDSFRREKLVSELREKLDEMEQKETAYRETLEHADRIVASVEQGYRSKIEELEMSEKSLKLRVGQLEEDLRGALQKERRSSDGRRPEDLVVELMEAETRESGLKEKLEDLDQIHRSSTARVKELEKLREKLECQLSDRDELSTKLKRSQQELELARKSLTQLKKSETALKTSLHQVEGVLAETECQMIAKLHAMEEEKRGHEQTVAELRNQVRDLEKKLERFPEEDRIPIVIQSQVTSSRSDSKEKVNLDDIDYAEIDDGCVLNESCAANDTVTMPNSFAQLLQKKTTPLSFSSLPKQQSYRSKEVAKITPTTRQGSFPKKEFKQLIKKNPTNVIDGYDDARQNFEHCMIRAMAAMTKDLEKNKKHLNDNNSIGTQKVFVNNSSSITQKPSAVCTKEDNEYDEILPRPSNFRVVQQVGSDTLLVGWEYVNTSILEGFEVYVDGHLHETVYTPDRTKALVSGLNLNGPLRLSICALSHCGQMSEPEVLQLPSPLERNSGFFLDDEDEDDEEFFDDAGFEKQRPYSMEW